MRLPRRSSTSLFPVPGWLLGVVVLTLLLLPVGAVPAQAGTPLVSVSPDPIPLGSAAAASGALSKSGQIVTVTVGANKTLPPRQRIIIMECQEHVLVSRMRIDCDPTSGAFNDAAGNEIETNANGAFSVKFPINTLPTPRSGFDPFSNISVNAKSPVVLWIGFNFTDFNAQSLLSAPIPLGTKGGPPAGSETVIGAGNRAGSSFPTLAVVVPVVAVGFGVLFFLRLRRRTPAR
jgi:hypothetical protein